MLYLVVGEVRGIPPAATVESLEAGRATLERLVELQRQGIVRGGGIFSGRSGICFVLDVESNTQPQMRSRGSESGPQGLTSAG